LSITPCQHLFLITKHDKPTWVSVDYHPVEGSGDLQFMLVGQNPAAFIIPPAPATDKIVFVHSISPIYLLDFRSGQRRDEKPTLCNEPTLM
jgi:hypothetical protein